MSDTTATWPDEVFDALRAAGVRQVAYVPDSGHTRLIDRCRADGEIAAVLLTTEEEGVALAAGAWLGGVRGALLMQSSGVGNCINMLSLTETCRFPLLMLVTMRGQEGETNPWQLPMGTTAGAVLELSGVELREANTAGAVAAQVAAAAETAYARPAAVAVFIAQGVVGVKTFGK